MSRWPLKIPSNPNSSLILWFRHLLLYLILHGSCYRNTLLYILTEQLHCKLTEQTQISHVLNVRLLCSNMLEELKVNNKGIYSINTKPASAIYLNLHRGEKDQILSLCKMVSYPLGCFSPPFFSCQPCAPLEGVLLSALLRLPGPLGAGDIVACASSTSMEVGLFPYALPHRLSHIYRLLHVPDSVHILQNHRHESTAVSSPALWIWMNPEALFWVWSLHSAGVLGRWKERRGEHAWFLEFIK